VRERKEKEEKKREKRRAEGVRPKGVRVREKKIKKKHKQEGKLEEKGVFYIYALLSFIHDDYKLELQEEILAFHLAKIIIKGQDCFFTFNY